ncbi:hypothetical protein BG004_000480 [Podila humilis]|nr:hypothetical protein BG004_000480 [Podila humilis]
MSVSSFTVSPATLCVGQTACLTITGTVNNPIVDDPFDPAWFTATGSYLGRIIFVHRLDFCDMLSAIGSPCNVPTGPNSFTICFTIPTNTPTGFPFQLTFAATNPGGSPIFCQTDTVTATTCV